MEEESWFVFQLNIRMHYGSQENAAFFKGITLETDSFDIIVGRRGSHDEATNHFTDALLVQSAIWWNRCDRRSRN